MRIIISIALLFAFNGIQAQWVDVGLKGGVGSSLFLNQNIFDDQSFNHNIKMGFTVGGKVGYNIGHHEVTLDIMYQQQGHEFNYSFDSPAGERITGTRGYNLSGMDYILMYRYNKETSYVEIGPQYSVYSNRDIYDTGGFKGENTDDLITDNNFGIALGFGSYMFGTENFGITTGVRFNYMFTDVFTSEGKNQNLPAIAPYPSYRETNILTAMFIIEFNYDLAYMTTAKCKGRRKIMFF